MTRTLLLIEPVQLQAKERLYNLSRVKLQLCVDADVHERFKEDDVLVPAVELQHAVKRLQVRALRVCDPPAGGVCVGVALAGGLGVHTQVSVSRAEEEQVPGLVPKTLHHQRSPFGCRDHLTVEITHDVSFRERTGRNHSCNQENVTF